MPQGIVSVDKGVRVSQRKGVGNSTSRLYAVGFRHSFFGALGSHRGGFRDQKATPVMGHAWGESKDQEESFHPPSTSLNCCVLSYASNA